MVKTKYKGYCFIMIREDMVCYDLTPSEGMLLGEKLRRINASDINSS